MIIKLKGATGVHVVNELLKCGLFNKVTSVARREFDYQGPNKDRLVCIIHSFIKNYNILKINIK